MSKEAIEEGQAFMNDPANLFKDGQIHSLFSTDTAKWVCAAMTNPGEIKTKEVKVVALYHYSDSPLDVLETRFSRGDYTPEVLKKAKENAKALKVPGNYLEHISLMIEPLPRNVASIFKGKHEFYKPGKELYEHVVFLKSLDGAAWELVSSPEEVAEYRAGRYEREDILKILNANNYIGKGIEVLEKHIKRFTGTIEFYFNEWANSQDEKRHQQYAGGVPHIMVYPPSGKIPVVNVRKIKLS